MTTLSIQEIEEQLDAVAKISIEALQLATKKELVKYCKGIVKNASKMTKEEMINAILLCTKDKRNKLEILEQERILKEQNDELERQAQLLQTIEESAAPTDEHAQTARRVIGFADELKQHEETAFDYFKKLKSNLANYLSSKNLIERELMILEAIPENEKTDKVLADSFRASQKLNKHQSDYFGKLSGYANSLANSMEVKFENKNTLKRFRTDVFNEMRSLANKETSNREELLLAIDNFRQAVCSIHREVIVNLDRDYKTRVKENTQNRSEFNPIELFERYYAIITNPSKYKWTYVLLALGFATGRRPSELLVSCDFQKIGEYEIAFKGQAKKRNVEKFDPHLTLKIPTLFKADYVINGLNYLRSQEKYIQYNIRNEYDALVTTYKEKLVTLDDSKFTQRYDVQKEFTEDLHQLFVKHTDLMSLGNTKFGKEISRTVELEEKQHGYKLTMKDLRSIYAYLTNLVYNDDSDANAQWFVNVLGHGGESEILGGDTFNSYQRFVTDDEMKVKFKELVINQK